MNYSDDRLAELRKRYDELQYTIRTTRNSEDLKELKLNLRITELRMEHVERIINRKQGTSSEFDQL